MELQMVKLNSEKFYLLHTFSVVYMQHALA